MRELTIQIIDPYEGAIDKKCPICGAAKGERCRSLRFGGTRGEPHWYRAGVR